MTTSKKTIPAGFARSAVTAMAALTFSMLALAGNTGSPATPSASHQPSKLVVIGNSLTRHPPNADIGWPHDWGMAASSQDRDYAHIAAAALRLPLELHSIPDFEADPKKNAFRIAEATANIDKSTVVVVELGDNTKPETLPDFNAGYDKLLAAASGRQVVCLSTWWNNSQLDAQMKKRCESNGGRYVYIGDIHGDPANPDKRSGPQYAVPAVNDHPHDWSMARIAERVLGALRATREEGRIPPATR